MSRPRSGRAASSAPARAGGRPGVYVQTPKSDVYVALLGLSLAAMFIGCILLVLVWKRYDFKVKPAFVPVNQAAPVALASHAGNISSVRL
ncbi:MAG: hypothetical protein P4L84_16405 [Isosphaeraceae bacterium]|nr:hypothetical protein [Isosphaeraceae bacterium]